jgi:hypothetical protein
MTLFRSLGARRLALLAVVFVIGVACAKVERNYDDDPSAGASNGGNGGSGIAGAGTGGKAGSPSGDAGSAGESGAAGSAGSAGENFGGAAGLPGVPLSLLTVTLAGDGTGVVTSAPLGINCGTQCSVEFDPDTEVVLTAAPAANSTFSGWSGGGCSGTGTCTTVLSAETTVKATFTSIKAPLTVTLAGTGVGVVKSVPAGIDCGATCSLPVPVGSSVQLTATPATGSIFAGWAGGGCTGTGTCTTTVNAAAAVTATFTLTTHTLTVVKAGTGQGAVTSAPGGINCGADCAETYNYGSVVILTAAPAAGIVFTGWTGACTGTGACTVTVTAATQVTATFTCSGNVPVNYSGAITTFTVPSCVTALTIEAFGAQGGGSGTYGGGSGARIKGTFAGLGGTTLRVLVGGAGRDAIDTQQQEAGSGGGGTFVTTAANSPLVVAGGGGGAGLATPASNGLGGAITSAGLAGSGGAEAGGINGLGGTSSTWVGWHGGSGGGGLLGNGVNLTSGNSTSYGTPNAPGMAFVNGGAGGIAGNCGTPPLAGCTVGARNGGFGGGGAAGFTGGGGGGYSGGGAGQGSFSTATSAGGGGGSYNGGTAQTNVAGARLGNGMVVFTY